MLHLFLTIFLSLWTEITSFYLFFLLSHSTQSQYLLCLWSVCQASTGERGEAWGENCWEIPKAADAIWKSSLLPLSTCFPPCHSPFHSYLSLLSTLRSWQTSFAFAKCIFHNCCCCRAGCSFNAVVAAAFVVPVVVVLVVVVAMH